MSKAKRIGTTAETAVVKYMIDCGYEDAHRVVLHGNRDEGDIHINCNKAGIPNMIIEVKSRKNECTYKEVEGFMQELERESINTWNRYPIVNKTTEPSAFLVIKRPGKGKVEDWWLCWKEEYKLGPVIVRCRLGDFFKKKEV